jgi:hypothetical protein
MPVKNTIFSDNSTNLLSIILSEQLTKDEFNLILNSIKKKNIDYKQYIYEIQKTMSNVSGGKKKSDYNIFIKKELERLKKKNPNKDHKERFKEAAKNWKNKK